MTINRFDTQHTGDYTCRPIPPQNVQSPAVTLDLGREYSQRKMHVNGVQQQHKLSKVLTSLYIREYWFQMKLIDLNLIYLNDQ